MERLDRLSDIGEWRLPIDGGVRDELVWWRYSGKKRCSDAADALESFIELRGADDRGIGRFVKRWSGLAVQSKLSEAKEHPEWRESVQFYRFLPQSFHAARQIHAYISCREIAPAALWRDLYRWPLMYVPGLGETSIDRPFWQRTPDNDALFLSDQLNAWLAHSEVRPALRWLEGRRFGTIEFNVRNLFGALVVHLLKEISNLSEFVICSNPECRETYEPQSRRPKYGQRHFCPQCRSEGVPQKLALRDFHARGGRRRSKSV